MRRRFVAAGLAICVGAAALFLLTDDGDYAGRLVQFVPSDVDAVLRCEGVDCAENRFAKLLGVDRLADVRGFLAGPDAARAVLGREVVVTMRDDEWLVATRLSRSGRAFIDAAIVARGAAVPNRAGRLRRIDAGRGAAWFAARTADVLVVGTDETFVRDAMECGARQVPATDAPFRAALGGSTPIAGRVEAWSRGESAAEWLGLVLDGGPASVVLDSLPLDESKALGAALQFDADGAHLTWTTDFGAAVPADTAALVAPDAAPAEELVAIARSLAPPDETMLVAGARLPAEEALRRFFESLPEPLRNPERESGAVDSVAALAKGGAAFVLARLRETDRLDVESPAANAPEAVAGSIVALRLRDPRDGDAAVRIVADAFRGLRRDDPRWTLIAPAAAVSGDLLVIASYEPLLARALAARASMRARPAGASSSGGDAAFLADISGPRVSAFAEDLRGSVGRAARPKKSASLRRAVLLHRRATHPAPDATLDAEVDAETERLAESRGAAAFHDAVDAHRARIAPLAQLASAAASVRFDGGAVVVHVDVRLR